MTEKRRDHFEEIHGPEKDGGVSEKCIRSDERQRRRERTERDNTGMYTPSYYFDSDRPNVRVWSCSKFSTHQHHSKAGAYLCGRAQFALHRGGLLRRK